MSTQSVGGLVVVHEGYKANGMGKSVAIIIARR
jgi:hypothetical protein